MSYCEEYGKDKVVFMTKEDNSTESKIQLSDMPDDYNRGLIMPDGDINFNCPCLGGMASGPCGFEFRDAFSCFHYSTSEVKGSECVDKFMEMQNCMTQFPNLYSSENSAMDKDSNEVDPLDMQSLDNQMKATSTELQTKSQWIISYNWAYLNSNCVVALYNNANLCVI